jgi:hypothetical protein
VQAGVVNLIQIPPVATRILLVTVPPSEQGFPISSTQQSAICCTLLHLHGSEEFEIAEFISQPHSFTDNRSSIAFESLWLRQPAGTAVVMCRLSHSSITVAAP